jgi:hypothetical protein
MNFYKILFLFPWITVSTVDSFSQDKTSNTSSFKTISARPSYDKSHFYQWLWGKNRRIEWTTPIQAPILLLDTAYGGLTPFKTGGGNESKTFHLKTSEGKEYSLRSINKSRKDVIPPEYKNTFIEDIINDGIFMSYPYGAFALPVMEEKLSVYHTNPQLVYLPQQNALDTFNKKFGNDLYLFEQRLDGDWSDANNLGNFKYFTSTDDVVKKLLEDNNNRADQLSFIKARLFDMLIGDWDRHEDNWQWGSIDTSSATYHPVPRDRDQAFYTHDGVLIDRLIPVQGLGFMQNFDYDLKDAKMLNFEERNMDRFFSNEMTIDDWIRTAQTIRQLLADETIEQSVRQLPPEIFAVSGQELIEKLKSRREHLVKYATEYYLFLAKEVEVTGSKQREYFYVDEVNNNETSVKIFRINASGNRSDTAFYSRIFKPAETKEIRLYGIDGEDLYKIEGTSNSIHIRIIGGPQKDTVIETSSGVKTDIYDDDKNIFQIKHASLHLQNDSAIHSYNYAAYNYDKHGLSAVFSYDYDDRLYIGLGYGLTHYAWRRTPFAIKQKAEVDYSLAQKAFRTSYNALFPNVINKWNVGFYSIYDAIKWKNFFGLGNETSLTTSDVNYFRIRTREWLVEADINKNFGKSTVTISPFFRNVKILNDTQNYLAKEFLPLNGDALETNSYAGIQLTYTYLSLDDSTVPRKGITFSGSAAYTFNVLKSEFFQNYYSKFHAYIPLFNKFSLAIRAGVATIAGNSKVINSAEFYEHAVIGGPENLRGFNRERFWGKTSFYNNNELRYITHVKTHLLNAKAGILAFLDDGKVWVPGENSNTTHFGYGAGILIAPFTKFCAVVTYGISNESRLWQFSFNKLF